VRRRALPALLESLDWPAEPGAPAGDEVRRLSERLFRPLRLWPTTCLYRALGSYALLRAAGQEVRFLIGVRKEGDELLAHAWLERDGQAIVSTPGPGDDYAVAYAWPADPSLPRRRRDHRSGTGITSSEEVVLTELRDATGVLLHLRTGFYFTLNPSGVKAWKLIDGGVRDAGELAGLLATDFPEVDAARIRSDIDALLSELSRESLIIFGK
jgi:hypothetical protein